MVLEFGHTMPVVNQIAIIFATGLVLKLLSKKTGFPFVVLLILAGSFLASISLIDNKQLGIIPDTLRILAIVIIVFANGFYLRLESITKQGFLILGLATIGVLISAGIIASVVHVTLGLALIPSLFLGSLLCGTDPEATENIIGKYPKKIQEILNAESILNSPFTVILPLIIFDFAVYRSPITFALPLYLAKIVLLCGVGFVIGLIGYFFGKKALQVAGVDLEELTGLAVALIVYVVAENLGGSGIIAVGVTSILLNSSKAPKKPTFTEFNRDIAIILVIFVFVMLGADFPIRMLNIVEITHIDFITVIGFIIAARLITALVISYKSDLNIWERLLIGMNSPKGMAPAALAPLAIVMAERSELMSTQAAYTIIKITYITIILSILLSMLIAHIYATIQKRKERKSEEIKTIEVPKKV